MKRHLLYSAITLVSLCPGPSLLPPASAQSSFQKVYNNGNSSSGASLLELDTGGYVIAGWSDYSFGTGMYISCLDSVGNVRWAKQYNPFLGGAAWANSIAQTSGGGYLVTGETRIQQKEKTYVVRMNSNGDSLWTRIFDLGGYYTCNYNDGIETFDKTYIIGVCSWDSTGPHTSLIKLDSLGDTIWMKQYGTSMRKVAQTSDSGFVIAGNPLIKTDSSGDMVWNRRDTTTSWYDIQETSDNGFIAVGDVFIESFNRDIVLARLDASGDLLWAKKYGGYAYEQAWSVKQTFDGGYVISGYTESFGAGASDLYLIKTDSMGDTLWTRAYGGYLDDWGFTIIQTRDSGFAFVGFTQIGIGPYATNMYFIKTGPQGNSNNLCHEFGTQTAVNDYPATWISPGINITSSGFMAIKNSASITSVFPAPLDTCDTIYWSIRQTSDMKNHIDMYPNPFTCNITLKTNSPNNESASCKIYNLLGEQVYAATFNTPKFNIDLGYLPNGMYVVKIRERDKISIIKIVKQ